MKLFAAGFALAIALCAVVGLLIYDHVSNSGATSVKSTPLVTARASVPDEASSGAVDPNSLVEKIQQETARLELKDRSIVLTSEKGVAAKAAIKRGDYEAASQAFNEVLSQSKVRDYRFYPINTFMDRVADAHDPEFLDRLNTWIDKEPKSAAPYLIRAMYYSKFCQRCNEASQMVGSGPPHTIKQDRDIASDDALKAIELDNKNPLGYFLLLGSVSGGINTPELEDTFQRAIKQFPEYYQLFRVRLGSLKPDSGGSIDAMYAFVERYAGKAPDASPLRLLYLQLYADLLGVASRDCQAHPRINLNQCIATVSGKIIKPDVSENAVKSLDLYQTTDSYQFGLTFKAIIDQMIATPGCAAYTGAILQMAASKLGVETQLSESNPGHNNYLLDDLIARVWLQSGYNDNAEKKFEEALVDIGNTHFSSEEEKDMAESDIYDSLMYLAQRKSQYLEMIVYQNAADAFGGIDHSNYPYMKCFAYFHLQLFKEGVDECTSLIDNNLGYIHSYYWRARSFDKMGKLDDALRDYEAVADSDTNSFQVSAVINMSVIYGKHNDFAGQLASMNKYPFIFDQQRQSADDLAVSYNNRCFALMKLGRLQEALDDCTVSLRYGNIPDAIQKQQALVKMLGKSG